MKEDCNEDEEHIP